MQEPANPPAQPHSGLGIASCILGAVSGAAFFVFAMLSLIARELDASSRTITLGQSQANNFEPFIPFLALTGAGVVLALGLGIAGLMQVRRKKTWAVIGCVIAAIAMLPMLELLAAI